MTRSIALLITAALVAAACGGSGDQDQNSAGPDSGADAEDVSMVATTREVTQVVVIGADASSLDGLRTALVEFDVGPSLEQVMIVGAPSCDDTGAELVVCRSTPEALEPTNGRQVLVVLDGGLDAAIEAGNIIGGQLSTVVSGDPDEDAAALAAFSASVTFVPTGLSELVADPAVTLFVGIDDALAAFTPVDIGDELVASRVDRFFDSRLQGMAPEPTDSETVQGAVPEPTVRWVLDLPEPLTVQASHERAVVVAGVVAFLGRDGVIRGVDAEDGTVLWSRETEADPFSASGSFVSASGDTLLVGTVAPGVNSDPAFEVPPDLPDKSLWALDILTGDLIWEVTVSPAGSIGHPATDGDRVFLWIAEDGVDISFRALDLADGSEVWRAQGVSGVGPPRVDNGEVWVGSADGALRGFDAQTGAELARFDRIGLGVAGVASRPAVSDDRVFFGNDNGMFYAIERTSGELVWSFETESVDLPSSPAIADDVVIFGSFDGGVYGLEMDSGELRWRYDSGNDLFLSSAALADDTVYIATFAVPSSVLALDARTGELAWQLPIGELVGASPFIDGDTVYIQTSGQFWAIAR